MAVTRGRRGRRETIDPSSARKRKSQAISRARGVRNVLAIRKATPAKKGFADLPGELRNKIYAMALPLTQNHCIRIVRPHATEEKLDMGLLGTCKAIRRETLPILYGCSFRIDFAYDSLYQKYKPYLTRFIDSTNETCASKYIRSFTFAYDHVDPNLSKGTVTSAKPSTEHADLVVVLKLLPKNPYYSFVVDERLTPRGMREGS